MERCRYYDNCPVTRNIKGFIMQTGDPTGTSCPAQYPVVLGRPRKCTFCVCARVKEKERELGHFVKLGWEGAKAGGA